MSIALILCSSNIVGGKDKPTRNVIITADEEKLRDFDGFSAIKELHQLLDDDASGSIDRNESSDFIAGDLKVDASGLDKRERIFHRGNDESITVDDLWEAWFQSDYRNWDTTRLIEWLVNSVKLPQYVDNFINAKATGISLPRMALQNSTFITNELGIKNFVHRQRLQIKALDLVLFGHYDRASAIKDVILTILIGLLLILLIFFRIHKNRSKQKMGELTSMLSKLKDMENDFEGARRRYEVDETESANSNASEHIQIQALTNQLIEAEKRLEMNIGYENSITLALQPLLRKTYEMETAYVNQQKLECLTEMHEAKDFVDRMRKKQTSILNSLKLATGSTGTDSIDSKIFSLKTRIEKIKIALDECQQRWRDIEAFCGFSILESSNFAERAEISIGPGTQMHPTTCHKALLESIPSDEIAIPECTHCVNADGNDIHIKTNGHIRNNNEEYSDASHKNPPGHLPADLTKKLHQFQSTTRNDKLESKKQNSNSTNDSDSTTNSIPSSSSFTRSSQKRVSKIRQIFQRRKPSK